MAKELWDVKVWNYGYTGYYIESIVAKNVWSIAKPDPSQGVNHVYITPIGGGQGFRCVDPYEQLIAEYEALTKD